VAIWGKIVRNAILPAAAVCGTIGAILLRIVGPDKEHTAAINLGVTAVVISLACIATFVGLRLPSMAAAKKPASILWRMITLVATAACMSALLTIIVILIITQLVWPGVQSEMVFYNAAPLTFVSTTIINVIFSLALRGRNVSRAE
jgi:hypothetical protein